jgi:chemotaxis protein MotB
MQRLTVISSVLVLGSTFVGTGCVPQDKYDSLLMAYRTQEEQVVRKDDELESVYASLDACRQTSANKDAQIMSMSGQIGGFQNALTDAEQRVDASLRDISQMEIGPLPADVERALTQLAAEYPNVLSFDASRGMLRFASDFTFDLGSATLRSDAAQTVRRLSEVLQSGTANQFEVKIVGHTDNVPIRRDETRRQHPTNMHLSVHRAISVADALESAGLDPVRVQVAGHGPYRPAVANRSGGVAENRRVEIYLAPMPVMATWTAPAPASPTAPLGTDSSSYEDGEPMK